MELAIHPGTKGDTVQTTTQETDQVADQVTDQVGRLLTLPAEGPVTATEIMRRLRMPHRPASETTTGTLLSMSLQPGRPSSAPLFRAPLVE